MSCNSSLINSVCAIKNKLLMRIELKNLVFNQVNVIFCLNVLFRNEDR